MGARLHDIPLSPFTLFFMPQLFDEKVINASNEKAFQEKDALIESLRTEKHTWQAVFMSKNDVDLGKFKSFMDAVDKKPK